MQQAVSDLPRGVNAQVSPEGRLELLAQEEVHRLRDASQSHMYELMWRCAFAVLNLLRVRGEACEELRDVAGLVRRQMGPALLLVLAMFTLMGLPPTWRSLA